MDKQIKIQFKLSPLGNRARKWLGNDRDFALLLDLFSDAYLLANYRDFSLLPITKTNRFRKIGNQRISHPDQKIEQTAQVPLMIWKKLQPLQRKNLSLSWICEEAIFFGWKRGLIRRPDQIAA